MDTKSFKELKKRAQHSVKVQKMLRDGTFWNNKILVDELFDDSYLHEEGGYYGKQKIKIGNKYQADITDMIKKNSI